MLEHVSGVCSPAQSRVEALRCSRPIDEVADVVMAALLGLCLGYIGSMPVAGPIAVLVLGRGLEDRSRNGLYIALGAAIAESVYAYLAFWGFSAFLTSYPWVESVARVAAAVLLMGLGVHFYRKRPAGKPIERPSNVGNKRSFFLGFTITALNPTLIATWTFTVTTVYSFGIVTFNPLNALPFSLGAFSGIVLWFATMLYLLKRFRSKFARAGLDRLMRVMGVVLICAGFAVAVHVAYRALHPAHPRAAAGAFPARAERAQLRS